ncbi:progonadoliberin-1-like [Syngnathus typhle]|uniref:progonadoliberin-1-like n=1 Tax=Syngnathus typhle TaxID=161592 RepID=UPI002A69CCE2|nr:progonadoliberin-1-like [Syngnathus typhle]
MKSLVLWLLILTTSMQVIYSQHWSYGLNPGGKRELLLLDKQTNVPVSTPTTLHSFICPFIHIHLIYLLSNQRVFSPLKVIDGFRHVEKPCKVVACGHLSLFAKICRMNEFHVSSAFGAFSNDEETNDNDILDLCCAFQEPNDALC